jgi:hypothetical protein
MSRDNELSTSTSTHQYCLPPGYANDKQFDERRPAPVHRSFDGTAWGSTLHAPRGSASCSTNLAATDGIPPMRPYAVERTFLAHCGRGVVHTVPTADRASGRRVRAHFHKPSVVEHAMRGRRCRSHQHYVRLIESSPMQSLVAHIAQDYLIFHPPRKGYEASGEALGGSGLRPWQGVVWTDPWRQHAQSNEDPFVWDSSVWLYSYCHASQLRRKPDPHRATVCEGSRLFFCETVAGRSGWLRVDTVFVVDDLARWQEAGVQVPDRFSAHQAAEVGNIWSRHLRHGLRPLTERGHTGHYTYVANLDGRSYLPLDTAGRPTAVLVADIQGLSAKVKAALPEERSTYPCELTPQQANALDSRLRASAATLVAKLTSGGPTKLPAIPPSPFATPAAV